MKLLADPFRLGVVAEYDSVQALAAALRSLRDQGYRRLDAYVPYGIDSLEELLHVPRTRVPWAALAGGLFGVAFAYSLPWFCNAYDYPIDVGGRPLHSALAFVPITFETAILFASLTTFVAVLAVGRLPEPWSPLSEVPGFERASVDRFWLGIDERDPQFRAETSLDDLQTTAPLRVVRPVTRP